MLTGLDIKGLAVIDELSIRFGRGFNVITGETGAGKSILIKALQLLLGGKADVDVVRHGCERATIVGLFVVPRTHAVVRTLQDLEIEFEVSGERPKPSGERPEPRKEEHGEVELIIRRTISHRRSAGWINDTSVTMKSLRAVGGALIEVFGQHDHARILDPALHTSFLDGFLRDPSLSEDVRGRFSECMVQMRKIRHLITEHATRKRNKDYLEFRFSELEAFGPSIDDYQSVQDLCNNGGKSLERQEALASIQSRLDPPEGGSISSILWALSSDLEAIGLEDEKKTRDGEPSASSGESPSDSPPDSLLEVARDAAGRVDELSYQIEKRLSGIDCDEGAIESAQERLSRYQALFRKMAVTDIHELMNEVERLEAELKALDVGEFGIQEEMTGLIRKADAMRQRAEALTKARRKAGKVAKSRVEGEFRDLAMPGARFDVRFDDVAGALPALETAGLEPATEELWETAIAKVADIRDCGFEKAAFLLAANPGEPLLPLEKTASGGEASRIMLAIKKSLAAGANTCVLVFDEIDTGISGRVAAMVGQKMRELSEDFQLLCISHLAQVAACSDTHFSVRKLKAKKRTQSTIVQLSKKDSLDEIAGLLSSDGVDAASLANARKLRQRLTRQ